MLQRKEGAFGKTLGKTTGWIHRAAMKDHGVKQISGVKYERISDVGLVVSREGREETVACDQIVVCAGQESVVEGLKELEVTGVPFSVIGGARLAGELDAKRAIREGFEAVAKL
jgi:2,4-dienoyl-CoA reductase (NADPH2)